VIVATCALPMGKVTLSESVCEVGRQVASAAKRTPSAPPGCSQSGERDQEPDEAPMPVVAAALADAWDRTTRDGTRPVVRPVVVTRISCWSEPDGVSAPAWSRERFREARTVTPREAGTLPIVSHAPPART